MKSGKELKAKPLISLRVFWITYCYLPNSSRINWRDYLMRALCFVTALAVSIPLTQIPMQEKAEACGCTSPPVPDGPAEFAINQSAEHIIYEVEEGFVTAHVLIRYAGNPEEFAWIVPVPSVPELSLSPSFGFSLLDRDTKPQTSVSVTNDCPVQEWDCQYAAMPYCNSGGGGWGCNGDDDANGVALTPDAATGGASDASGGSPPVEVLDRQLVGSYETVVISAGDSAAAVAWLQNEGFIVNETMAPYMQPYADAGMVFLASRLVAGADVSEIKPLRMKYAGDKPMIPLRLTAIAAEPEMTITTYIYGDSHFVPEDFPLAEINQDWISIDQSGRTNYPMVLSRSIDEAGGKSFVAEYVGAPIFGDFDQGSGCCSTGFDLCNLRDDGLCTCPGADFEALDCQEDGAERLEGAAFLDALANKYTSLTRLTTRMSAEDMSYDPVFKPQVSTPTGRLLLTNDRHSLSACESDVIDKQRYDEVQAIQECSTTYCGTGACAITSGGAACECFSGSVARIFTDLDGIRSVTCVPEVAPVDLSAGGLELPDACRTINCGMGTCRDLGGFPTCECAPGAAADATKVAAPTCLPIIATSNGPGADDYTTPLADMPVCAPVPPQCGEYGWNVPADLPEGARRGFQCATSVPSTEDRRVASSPTCEDLGRRDDSGCASAASSSGLGSLALFALVFFAAFGRRRRNGEFA